MWASRTGPAGEGGRGPLLGTEPLALPGEVTTAGLQSTGWKVSRSCPGEELAGWRGAGEKVVTAKVAQERTKARIGAAAAWRAACRLMRQAWGVPRLRRGGSLSSC